MAMEKIQYKIEGFEGPLDLLLHLISKHKLDINDIPIFTLVQQYVDYVRQMQDADMQVASEFVEMAARLVYIKTVSLLPVHDEGETLKKELEGQLIEYQLCKEVAKELSTHTDGFDYSCREMMKFKGSTKYERQHTPAEILMHYVNAIGRGRRKLPPPIESFNQIVSTQIVSVNSRVVFIYRKLIKHGERFWNEFFIDSKSKSEMVATFLAILEMMKANKITLKTKSEQTIVVLSKRENNERENKFTSSD